MSVFFTLLSLASMYCLGHGVFRLLCPDARQWGRVGRAGLSMACGFIMTGLTCLQASMAGFQMSYWMLALLGAGLTLLARLRRRHPLPSRCSIIAPLPASSFRSLLSMIRARRLGRRLVGERWMAMTPRR